MGDKSVKTLGSKIRFSNAWNSFPPFPQNNVDFFISLTAQTSAYTPLNWGARDIRELTLGANKIEQMLKVIPW